ncbi:hypothetical protein Apa02nite_062960 [Actinoplanes palleronii]|uniref:Uncharacterized protein n=3 Tax=Micromonosporaceae TaxID=28056 RepID=A0A101JAD8_9ACTN|nr:hypothetical protein ADL15_46725 [Actinoplanes awajinensis subsp. mycoplanecinus]GIE70188.1 hypothetical protein Apa02nite_062960 [Actinoplanes palleronii]
MMYAEMLRSVTNWQRLDRHPTQRDRMPALVDRFFREGGMVLLNARTTGRPDYQIADWYWPSAERA